MKKCCRGAIGQNTTNTLKIRVREKYLDARVRLVHGQIAKRVLDVGPVEATLNDKIAAIKRPAIVQTGLDAFSDILDRHGRGVGSQPHGHVAQGSLNDQGHGGLKLMEVCSGRVGVASAANRRRKFKSLLTLLIRIARPWLAGLASHWRPY